MDPIQKFSIASEVEQKIFDEAVIVMENLRPEKKAVAKEVVQAEWQKVQSILEKSTSDQQVIVEESQPAAKSRFMPIMRYAAAVVLLLLGFAWFQSQPTETGQTSTHVTNYQEKLNFLLADGTEVNLASHSSMRSAIIDGSQREVWLEGEAFFHVTKRPDQENPEFVVHVGGLDVVVLGTQFNVLQRNESVIIALKEGSVRLMGKGNKELLMAPGEVVHFDLTDHTFEKGSRDDAYYYAWLEDKIILDETTLRELSVVIQDKFGVSVQIKEEALRNRKLSGVVPDKDLQVIINAIKSTLDVNVDYENKDIVIY